MTLLDGSGKAPAVVSELAFSRARAEEMVRTDFEFLQPDGADAPLYSYVTRWGDFARRYWSIRGKLLVGGTIRDQSDAMHLASNFGVTHVLSFESEQDDDGLWSQARRARAHFPDDGKMPPLGPMIQTVKWVKDLPHDAVLYTHCRLGYSRGPTAAYLALRVRWQMNRETAQKYAGKRQDGSALLSNYLARVDEAVRLVTGRRPTE